MAVELIGFEHDGQNLSAVWGSQTVRESLLIKMDSPLQDVLDVQAALPAYDGGITPEPTFTIGRSYHPERPDLVLKEAPSVRVHPEGGRPYFLVDLVYETATWVDQQVSFPGEQRPKGNVGRKKIFNGANNIKYPWDEPPTWSGGTESVRLTTYRSAPDDDNPNGLVLRHANGLPLTEGIDIEIMLESHTFTWNVSYSSFSWKDDVAPYVGKLNSANCFTYAPLSVFLKSVTAVENYRTVNIPTSSGESTTGATATHHFVTLTATFLIDTRETTHGYWREATRRVSMHTLQKVPATIIPPIIYTYIPIDVNDRGDKAVAPWPLDPLGQAIPYTAMDTVDPETDFGFVDPLYPRATNLQTFVNNNDLAIP